MTDSQQGSRTSRKRREGVVVSRSGNKSVVVLVERRFSHPVYGKVLRKTRKFHVHDEKNEAKVGDRVLIGEGRPMSRLKRWWLISILEKAAGTLDGQK